MKKIEISSVELEDKLMCNVRQHFWKISECKDRSDLRRTKVMRLAKKVPAFVLTHVESRSKYKNDDNLNFHAAYFNAFYRFIEFISEEGHQIVAESMVRKYVGPHWTDLGTDQLLEFTAENLISLPTDFYNFISFNFPKKKLKKYIDCLTNHVWEHTGFILPREAEEIIEILQTTIKYRDSSSKEDIKFFIRTNRMYSECLKLVKKY